MNLLTGRFKGVTRLADSFRLSRSAATSQAHRSFRLTRPTLSSAKQKEAEIKKLIDKGYIPHEMKLKELRQSVREGKILTPAERREFLHLTEEGHKLETKESLIKFETALLKAEQQITDDDVDNPLKYKFQDRPLNRAERLRQNARELYRGLQKEAKEGPGLEKATALEERNAKLQERNARLARIGVRPNSMAARPLGDTPTGSIQEVQPLTPGTAPAKTPTTNRPLNLMNTGIIAGRHTDVSNHVDNPVVVAPTSDPIAEENQLVVEQDLTNPPTKPVDLPDTSKVDIGLPF